MASRRYMPLAAILITICLDISSVVVNVVAAAVVWDPRTSRYDSYNLDKGPVFYEAYYPDAQDAYHEKRYFDRSTVLETSFQVPSERFVYSAESADRPVSNDESSYVAADDEENLPVEQRKIAGSRRNPVPFQDRRSMLLEDDDGSFPMANIGEISKLVRRAISRDLENWNALERYLDHAGSQDQSIPRSAEIRSRESRKNKEIDGYPLQVNQLNFDSSKQPSLEVLRKLEALDAKLRPAYFEEVPNGAIVGDARAADDIVPDSLSLENIFQPRPQIIKYTFLKKATTRLDEPSKDAIDSTTPRNYGDNLIREEIANEKRDSRLPKGNVKVTSIQVSELPRHKTRHHHGELPKRDYTAHRHRSAVDQSDRPVV